MIKVCHRDSYTGCREDEARVTSMDGGCHGKIIMGRRGVDLLSNPKNVVVAVAV